VIDSDSGPAGFWLSSPLGFDGGDAAGGTGGGGGGGTGVGEFCDRGEGMGVEAKNGGGTSGEDSSKRGSSGGGGCPYKIGGRG